jgi:hypothetical protein
MRPDSTKPLKVKERIRRERQLILAQDGIIPPNMMLEKDGIRGAVPGRMIGRKDVVYGEYLRQLNPRVNKSVQLALASTPDVRFQEFVRRVMTPRYKRISMQAIAKACSISLMEFNKWWQTASAQCSIGIAQTASVDLTHDMVADARSREVVCERCDGLGIVNAPAGLKLSTPGYERHQRRDELTGMPIIEWTRECPSCEGSGRVRKPGDAHSRDRVLEMASLINRNKSGVTINIPINQDHASAVGDLESAMTIDVQPEESDVA